MFCGVYGRIELVWLEGPHATLLVKEEATRYHVTVGGSGGAQHSPITYFLRVTLHRGGKLT